jgi:hypothetical protein
MEKRSFFLVFCIFSLVVLACGIEPTTGGGGVNAQVTGVSITQDTFGITLTVNFVAGSKDALIRCAYRPSSGSDWSVISEFTVFQSTNQEAQSTSLAISESIPGEYVVSCKTVSDNNSRETSFNIENTGDIGDTGTNRSSFLYISSVTITPPNGRGNFNVCIGYAVTGLREDVTCGYRTYGNTNDPLTGIGTVNLPTGDEDLNATGSRYYDMQFYLDTPGDYTVLCETTSKNSYQTGAFYVEQVDTHPDLDVDFGTPQYYILSSDGSFFLYPNPPVEGILVVPDGTGGTYSIGVSYFSGPYNNGREVCVAEGSTVSGYSMTAYNTTVSFTCP